MLSKEIEQLLADFAGSEYHRTTIVGAIEKAVGRKLVVGKDHVFVDFVERKHKTSKEPFQYGAVVMDGVIYGFLDIDWGEPCIRFTPSSELLPLK